MELILFGIGFIALLATVVVKANKRDPRFADQRLMNKGLLLFGVGWLMLVLGASIENNLISTALRYVGYAASVIGFGIAGFGNIKHLRLMFGPVDTRRAVDPNYDVPYTECPHCHKVEVRVIGSKAKCPKCGGVIRADERTDA